MIRRWWARMVLRWWYDYCPNPDHDPGRKGRYYCDGCYIEHKKREEIRTARHKARIARLIKRAKGKRGGRE